MMKMACSITTLVKAQSMVQAEAFTMGSHGRAMFQRYTDPPVVSLSTSVTMMCLNNGVVAVAADVTAEEAAEHSGIMSNMDSPIQGAAQSSSQLGCSQKASTLAT